MFKKRIENCTEIKAIGLSQCVWEKVDNDD
jgi:hypothetical protein